MKLQWGYQFMAGLIEDVTCF